MLASAPFRFALRATRYLHATPRLLKDALVPVPGMGDSITEGTLIKFAVAPGQAVKLDDIVCVIETDKVRAVGGARAGTRLASSIRPPCLARGHLTRHTARSLPPRRSPSTCAARCRAF